MSDTGTIRLLIVSDTHVPKRARELPAQVWRAVALDAEGLCADMIPARAQAVRPTSFDGYPWLVEANAALTNARNCAITH